MQRSGGAVTLMLQTADDLVKNLLIEDDVSFLYPVKFDIIKVLKQKPLVPFSEPIIELLDSLSKRIFANPRSKYYSDVITFAFWCRRSNLLKLKEEYSNKKVRMGRGLAFHISPSNVPINFAFSLVSGLLAGNINIVRVPSKNFEQIQIISAELKELLQNEYSELSDFVTLIRYDKQSNATKHFSSICDIRVIWGGDQTVSEIRKFALPSRGIDITFADRYSICAINADEFLKEQKPEAIANGFYNDTYFYDQNACSAPHLIVWLGSECNVKKSKAIFWSYLDEIVHKKYTIEPIKAVDKLTAFYRQAIEYQDLEDIKTEDNFIKRIHLINLKEEIENYRCYAGYFCEYDAKSLDEISCIINIKYQTLAYYGFSKEVLTEFKIKNRINGIDRIVPIGQTSSFSLTWDGYNLIDSMSNTCDIQ